MEYRFAIDSRKCMNHDQPLKGTLTIIDDV